jgi:hypothetical protein
MTVPAAAAAPSAALIDGVDVDAAALAVLSCPGVSGLDGGRFGEVASYLPGRRVAGVTAGGGRVRVQVRSRWGIPVADLVAQITAALGPVTGHPVDVIIADIDDPPAVAGRAAAGPGPSAAKQEPW